MLLFARPGLGSKASCRRRVVRGKRASSASEVTGQHPRLRVGLGLVSTAKYKEVGKSTWPPQRRIPIRKHALQGQDFTARSQGAVETVDRRLCYSPPERSSRSSWRSALSRWRSDWTWVCCAHCLPVLPHFLQVLLQRAGVARRKVVRFLPIGPHFLFIARNCRSSLRNVWPSLARSQVLLGRRPFSSSGRTFSAGRAFAAARRGLPAAG